MTNSADPDQSASSLKRQGIYGLSRHMKTNQKSMKYRSRWNTYSGFQFPFPSSNCGPDSCNRNPDIKDYKDFTIKKKLTQVPEP